MPQRRTGGACLAVALLLLAAPLAGQQEATTGTIRGRVTDEEGNALDGVAVAARNDGTGVQRTVLSDANGRYVLPLLPPGGPWSLSATRIGFTADRRTLDHIAAGERLQHDLVMHRTAVPLEELNVDVRSGTVDRAGVVQRITETEVARLPVRSRDFTGLLTLSPLVSIHPEIETGGRFAIGGARASGTSLQVDGVDTNNLFYAENQGSSRSPFAYSMESIGGIQLITNGFDVEYGNYQGGIVNAITRSGTNRFDASVFVFHRNEALTASDFAHEAPTDFRVTQYGGTLAGPIVRDRMHGFLTVDLQRKHLPLEAGSPSGARVSTVEHASIVSSLEDVYELREPSRFFGTFTGSQNNAVVFGRVDWNLGANHRLTLRQNYSSFYEQYDGLERNEAITNSAAFRDRVTAAVAELNSVLGERTTSSLRLQFSYEDRPRRPYDEGGYLPRIDIDNLHGETGGISRLSFGGDEEQYRNRLEETKVQLVENLTWRSGSHTLKLGTSDILSTTRHENWVQGNGLYVFPNAGGFAARQAVSYSRLTRMCPVALTPNRAGEVVICGAPDVPVADFDALEWSAYVQDEWQLTDRLTVTGGIRWGGTSLDQRPQRVPEVEERFGIPTTVVPSFAGISPRLSLTLDLGSGRTARAGIGRLVGRAPLVLSANAFQTERPLFNIYCTSDDVPTLDMAEMLGSPGGGANPAACRSGSARLGRPQFTVFSEDFELPRTIKANVGYETRLGSDARFSIDVLASRTTSNFHVRDLNLRQPSFLLTQEVACAGCSGRPVFVELTFGPIPYSPRKAAGPARLHDLNFDRIYQVVSEGEARSWNVVAEVQRRFGSNLEIAARYAWNHAYDNSSFSCCTSLDGFAGEPTAGDPSFIGDPGDDGPGAWGPSSFERRHVFVGSALLDAPLGIRVDALLRLQSGTPWTPIVAGDLNADGEDRNDRPYIGLDLQLASAQDSALWVSMLAKESCLASQTGRIAARNSCRNPWWNSLDLRLSRDFGMVGTHRAEVTVDFYNVLNGISSKMGQYARVAGERRVLLQAVQYRPPAPEDLPFEDPTADRVIYRVNPDFGRLQPVGFEPFQFQVQLGLRYRF